jgi:outer membrane protein assembly factor BamB
MNALITSLVAAALALAAPRPAPEPAGAWLQWGGPSRDFVVDARPLASSWPEGGPKRLWARPLGDGFSSIVTDGATLYTLYRSGADDVAIAMEAATGKTKWETRYAAPFNETCSQRLGPGPRAAPVVAGDRLITISAGGLMTSFDRATGKVQWTHDLLATTPQASRACGYSTSPLVYKNTVITTAGGKGRGVVAVDIATGKLAWQAQDFENGYSSPILIDLDGRPELVVFTAAEIAGLDPDTGRLEWQQAHPAEFGVNVTTPIWAAEDHLLFVSSAYSGGSRVLKLARAGSTVSASQVWASQRVRIHFGNAVRFGKRIYASNGDFGSAPLAAIDLATGDMAWRSRAVARATLVGAGSILILLDEDGNLAIGTPTDEGLTVQAKAQVMDGLSWTAPTLSGTTLYIRNQKQIVALDLR